MDFGDINDIIKEYLKHGGYKSALECFESEEKSKMATGKGPKKTSNIVPKDLADPSVPRLYKLMDPDKVKMSREKKLEKDLVELKKKHGSVLQSAMQIFSIASSCRQQLHNIKDGNSIGENLGEIIENYKVQLGKYHKIFLSEGTDRSELFSEAVIMEHKKKLITAKDENNLENIIEVLLSLRVNALQISPELRKNLVYELIRNDVFLITAKKNNSFILELLGISSHALKHALCALISVIASTLKGVEYLVENDHTVLQKIIDILKEQEDGSVTQRFCIAILQKMSAKEDLVDLLVKNKMIDWIIKLIERSTSKEIHTFSLDFGSALLANILHVNTTLDFLEKDPSFTKNIMQRLLTLIRESIPTSVLMHILISLSYLSKERFSPQVEQCQFVDKISDFVEYFSQNNVSENENDEIDKRTVLDLCAHMFHPKDVIADSSQSMDINEMKFEDKIKELENEQGDLIFECFPDEVS